MKCLYHHEGHECPHMALVEGHKMCPAPLCPDYEDFKANPKPSPRYTRTPKAEVVLEKACTDAYNKGQFTIFALNAEAYRKFLKQRSALFADTLHTTDKRLQQPKFTELLK